MAEPRRALRCAIYTRKSTEEGLDQAFNSLHAQREACEAYIKSQSGEGWVLVRTIYDDGGFSGGSMERPALQQLLSDIDSGRVDVVVVYKVDRLTRSLTDFAKMVERFEKRSVSFVSVTQSFNTTNSMGRLTLNVLLSFAQFEREVASERIRDKLAASRKKGMWMGGTVPTGYDVHERKLVPNPEEANAIRMIFRRYLDLRSSELLRQELKARGIVSKIRRLRTGKQVGGQPFSRGALNGLLQNRVYVGEVAYKANIYPGEHAAIIDRDLFDQVQALLEVNRRVKQHRPKTMQQFPLTALIFDDRDNAMTPVHSQKGQGRRYRYYVSRALIDGERKQAGSIPRVPAQPVEDIALATIRSLLAAHDGVSDGESHVDLVGDLRRLARRVEISATAITLSLDRGLLGSELRAASEPDALVDMMRSRLSSNVAIAHDRDIVTIEIAIRAKFRGGEHHIVAADGSKTFAQLPRPDRALVKAIVRAHTWLKLLSDGSVRSVDELARKVGQDRGYTRRVLRLAFLSPTLTSQILDGTQPDHVSLTDLLDGDLPHVWRAQDTLFEL